MLKSQLTIPKKQDIPFIKALRRNLWALICSYNGLRFALKHEQSLRIEMGIFVVAFVLLQFFSVPLKDQVKLLGSLLFIIVMELQNTAIEKLADRITREYDETIKIVKDCSSAAVFVSLCVAAFAWLAHFYSFLTAKGWI